MISIVKKHNNDNGVWSNTYIITYSSGEIIQAPHDKQNRHYQEILQWVADGNTIQEAD
tara:strand:- start:83 stop:256 length:174 start_codon:yes stop_codon:yes gene_type:complete